MISDMVLLNSPRETDIPHILEEDAVIVVQEAGYHVWAGRVVGENVENLQLFAELFSFLVAAFRHLYYNERGHLVDIAVGSLANPVQAV